MNPLFAAAREIQDFMSGKGWQFCIIGGMAVSIAMRQRKTLNKDYILRTLQPLCELKEAPELAAMTRCILEGKKWRK